MGTLENRLESLGMLGDADLLPEGCVAVNPSDDEHLAALMDLVPRDALPGLVASAVARLAS